MSDPAEKFVDIDKSIEDTLVLSLRALMSLDKKYTYKDDESTRIQITSSRPSDQEMAKPHAYVSSSSYSVAEVGLSKGYAGDIIEKEGDVEKEIRQYKYRVSFSAEISVLATSSSESKNIANRIVSRLFLRGRKAIMDSFAFNITGIQKGRENKFSLSSNKDNFFVNPIGITGEFIIDVKVLDKVIAGILEHYKVTYSDTVLNMEYEF